MRSEKGIAKVAVLCRSIDHISALARIWLEEEEEQFLKLALGSPWV